VNFVWLSVTGWGFGVQGQEGNKMFTCTVCVNIMVWTGTCYSEVIEESDHF
jgi:hypothetical protein